MASPTTSNPPHPGTDTAMPKRPASTNIAAAQPPEGFVQIEGHPGHFISREGDVWSRKSGRLLSRVKNDYLDVNLDGVVRRVHVLVAKAFLPNPDPDRLTVVRHKDDSRYNCHLENLEWGTQSANASDSIDRQVYSPGWNFRELTDEKVLAIHADIVKGGVTQQEIADLHGVSITTVNAIKHGRLHRRLTGVPKRPTKSRSGADHHNAKLTVGQVKAIFDRAKVGERKPSLAREYGVSLGTVESICYGTAWNTVTGLPNKKRRSATASKAKRAPRRRAAATLERADPPPGLVPLPIQGLSKEYGITPDGLIYSHVSGNLIAIQTKGRYPKVRITHRGKTHNFLLHRLLALAFIPNPNGHANVRHLDDDQQNYSLDNLAWGSVAHNKADAIKNGIFSGRVLTDDQVRELVERVASGELSQREASKIYVVSEAAVSTWMLGKSRREITGRAASKPGMRSGEDSPAAKLSTKSLLELVAMVQSGKFTQRQVAEKYKVSTALVSLIKNGRVRSSETGIVPKGSST